MCASNISHHLGLCHHLGQLMIFWKMKQAGFRLGKQFLAYS